MLKFKQIIKEFELCLKLNRTSDFEKYYNKFMREAKKLRKEYAEM